MSVQSGTLFLKIVGRDGCGKHCRVLAKSLMDIDAPIRPRVSVLFGAGRGFTGGENESRTLSSEGLV